MAESKGRSTWHVIGFPWLCLGLSLALSFGAAFIPGTETFSPWSWWTNKARNRITSFISVLGAPLQVKRVMCAYMWKAAICAAMHRSATRKSPNFVSAFGSFSLIAPRLPG